MQNFLAERAMSEGSIGAGQAAVPPMLDPLLVLSNAGQANSFRQLCTIKTITTQTWRGITSAGVSAEWTAEAAEMTDASPALTQPTITPVKGDAYVQLSWELTEDSGLMADLAMLFADARDRLEATAFCTGAPASTQPTGITTALDLVTTSRLSCTTSGTVGVVDLYKMDGALPPRWRANANWMGNKAVLNEIRQAVNTTIANASPWVDFSGNMPSKAIGYGVFEASGRSTATASGTDCLILGDWRGGMYLVDRLPTVVASTPWIVGANRRPIGATGVAMHFRVGSDVVVPSAFIMLRR
jgi:HK97 family phage major capsid protein